MSDLLVQVRAQLRPSEELLWFGGPDPKVVFSSSDLIAVRFSLMWCGFAIFGETSAVAGGAPWFFRLWGIPFVLVGLYMVVGRFFYKRYLWQRTAYALTHQRAIVIGPRKQTDCPLPGTPVSVQRTRDGRHATITIGNSGPRARGSMLTFPGSGFTASNEGAVTFHDVLEPEPLLQALDRARRVRTVRLGWGEVARCGHDAGGVWVRCADGRELRASAFQYGPRALRFARQPAREAAARLEKIRKRRR